MEGAPGTLYEGEKFQLLFKFSNRYPFDSPQVNMALGDCNELFVNLIMTSLRIDHLLLSHTGNVYWREYSCPSARV